MSIQVTQFAEGAALSGMGQAGASERAAEGLFMGARVSQADNPMSLLADAAEELTFSLAESEESRLDERKEKAESAKKRAFDPYIEAARKLVQQGDGDLGRALNNLEKLFKAKNNAGLSELMEALGQPREKGGGGAQDPAEQFALLTALKDSLGEGHALAGVIDQGLEGLAEKQAFAVASGLAVDLCAPEFAGLGGKAELRDTYCGAVADFTSPRDALSRLCERFGLDKLNTGLDFIMGVLGNELSSAGPSMEKEQLKALTGDMAQVRVLGAVQTRCAALLERLDTAHGVKSKAGADQLLDNVLTVRDNQYAGPQDFQRMAAKVGLPDTEREVLFLQDTLQALRDLQDLFYEGDETRLRVQGAAQGALDDAVRREEEELGF